jgi:hypothetical protein
MPINTDPIIKPLKELSESRFTIEGERVLASNRFPYEGSLLDFFENLAMERIVSGKRPIAFAKVLKKDEKLLSMLSEADNFYSTLFDNDNLIPPSARDMENKKPMSILYVAIYHLFQGSRPRFDDSVGIYWTFREYYFKKICLRLVLNPLFNKLEHWSKLKTLLSGPTFRWDEWLNGIPKNALVAEKDKFTIISPNATLYQMAELSLLSAGRIANAKKYITAFKQMDRSDLLKFVDKATSGSEYLHYKKDITFRLALCEQLGAEVWLDLVQALKYPNLQDHAFLFLKSIDFYPGIFLSLAAGGNPNDHDRGVLILIGLRNFMQHIFKIGGDLLGYYRADNYYDHPNREQILARAEKISAEWFSKKLAGLFSEILNGLFPNGVLSGEFGIYFLRWFHGHKTSNDSSIYDRQKNRAIEVMDSIFKDFFYANGKNLSFILTRKSDDRYGWEEFRLLTSSPEAKPISKDINKKILDIHIEYIRSKKFEWSGDSEFNNRTIKQAYSFSELLIEQGDFLERWNELYLEFRLYHEGWRAHHGWDRKEMQKECYILTAGIGIAYRLYNEKQSVEARNLLTRILDKGLSQARLCRTEDSIYISPLAAALHTLKHCDQDILHEKVEVLELNTDNLRQLLRVLAVVYNKEGPMVPNSTRKVIRGRISRDYFIIENKFREPILNQELKYFDGLKDIILGSFKRKK